MTEPIRPVDSDALALAVKAFKQARSRESAARVRAERAKAAVAAAHEETEKARLLLAASIVDDARRGRRNAEIVKVTGYTRERVRQICRAAGVESAE